jgi:pantothenate kinase
MESTYEELATRALTLLEKSGSYRIIILLIGAPGSGKSTVAQRCVDILNKLHRSKGNQLDQILETEVLRSKNEDLPLYDPDDPIDFEDEHYKPKRELINDGLVIRGRGGDNTAMKIQFDRTTNSNDYAQVIPMDGFHLPRSVLAKFRDPELASLRRGSPFTFDSSLVVTLIDNLKETLDVDSPKGLSPLDTIHTSIPDIYIPSFDHTERDPKQYGTCIHSNSRILIMEGLYLLLNSPVWCDIPKILNPDVTMNQEESHITELSKIPIPSNKRHEFWKILIDDGTILSRLGLRHLQAGIVNSLEEGEERVKINDLPNGKRVYSESFKSDINIISIDDCNEVT